MQFDLYCGRAWIADVLSSIQMAGVLGGALLWGQMAELFGRKPVPTLPFATISLTCTAPCS